VQKARQVSFIHFRLARRDIIQLPRPHLFLQYVHQREQVIERIHDEQQWLVTVDSEA